MLSCAPVKRITFEGTRAVGVEGRFRHPQTRAAGASFVVRAKKGVVVAASVTVLALVVLRAVIPSSAAQASRRARDKQQARAIFGYGQRRFIVATSFTSRALYEADLRPVLEHILAARLADGHAVNLYTDPEAARRAFCRTGADESLWPWIDPAQALGTDARHRQRQGIPQRTLARLITRLEQL